MLNNSQAILCEACSQLGVGSTRFLREKWMDLSEIWLTSSNIFPCHFAGNTANDACEMRLKTGQLFSRTKSLTPTAAISFESNLQPPTVMLCAKMLLRPGMTKWIPAIGLVATLAGVHKSQSHRRLYYNFISCERHLWLLKATGTSCRRNWKRRKEILICPTQPRAVFPRIFNNYIHLKMQERSSIFPE